MHVQHAGADSLCLQLRLRNQGLSYFESAGDERDVFAIAVNFRLADLK
jgi:hypothetical protein